MDIKNIPAQSLAIGDIIVNTAFPGIQWPVHGVTVKRDKVEVALQGAAQHYGRDDRVEVVR